MQLCSVHLVRNSLNFVSWKQRKEVAADLRTIYPAATADDATLALDALALKWDAAYPQMAKSWRHHWARVIYTTNAIESVNYSLPKLSTARASPLNDEAAIKLMYLGLRNIRQRWTMPIQNWKQAVSRFMIGFEQQFNHA